MIKLKRRLIFLILLLTFVDLIIAKLKNMKVYQNFLKKYLVHAHIFNHKTTLYSNNYKRFQFTNRNNEKLFQSQNNIDLKMINCFNIKTKLTSPY